jgi:transposase
MADRERVGRDASPTAAIIDSQSAKTTEAGAPRGYDAGKKINGRKRHALVDTDGRGLVLEPHPASIQDRDGGGPLLRVSRRIFPFIQRVFADSGYAGDKVTTATLIAVEIVRKNPNQVGFAVNPRRWVVERFFAWIGRNRRLAKDFEATIDSARADPLRNSAAQKCCDVQRNFFNNVVGWNPRSAGPHAATRVHHAPWWRRTYMVGRRRAAIGPSKAHWRAVGWQLSEDKRASRSLPALA